MPSNLPTIFFSHVASDMYFSVMVVVLAVVVHCVKCGDFPNNGVGRIQLSLAETILTLSNLNGYWHHILSVQPF